jgi:acetolactate synthase I/II/III large subunit
LVALASAHGGHGETVASTEEFAPAFDRAMSSPKPTIIEVKFGREAKSTSTAPTAIRGNGKR